MHPFEAIVRPIVADDHLHARLLNTLSYMEHIGATKIARTQSGPQATLTTLKHAAEEARHAFYLRRLSHKLLPDACPDYQPQHLLAPIHSHQYLHRLDIHASRLAKGAAKLPGGPQTARAIHDLAYLLVTHTIELRADALYPIYETLLEQVPARISVQSIIAEETGHLQEMEDALAAYPDWIHDLTRQMQAHEQRLFQEWLDQIHATASQ